MSAVSHVDPPGGPGRDVGAIGRGRGHRPGSRGQAWLRAGMLATLTGTLLVTPLLADEPYEFARAAETLGALIFVGLWAAWCWVRGGVVARPSRTYLPIALLLGLVLLQLVPLEMPALARLSPRAAEFRRATAAALGDRLATAAPLSLDRGATAEELMLMASGVLFFWAAFNGPDDSRHLRRISLVLVGVGVAMAGLLFLQRALGDEALFWVTQGLDPAGVASFPNHNRYAGFLNACIGAGLGLIFEAAARRPDKSPGPAHLPSADAEDRPLRLGWLPALVPAVAAMAAAVVLSTSRGGTVALLAMLLAASVASLRRPGTRRRALLPAGVAALAVLLIVGLGWRPVADRLLTLADREQVEQSRLLLWRGALQAARDFPAFGVGLGGFRAISPLYQSPRLPRDLTYSHVENEYLQVLVELGVVGAVLATALLVAVLGAVRHAARGIGRGDGPSSGAALATMAVLTQSLGDFGFHGEGTPYLYILVIALCLRRAAVEDSGAGRSDPPPPSSVLPGGRVTVLAVGLALAALAAWMLAVEGRSVRVARHLDAVQRALEEGPASVAVRTLCDAHIRAAADERPDDADLQMQVATYFWSPAGPGSEARAYLARTLAARPVHGGAHRLLGDAYAAAGDPRAGPHLALAARLLPFDPGTHAHHGRWLLSRGRHEEALAAFIRAAALDPPGHAREVKRVVAALSGGPHEPIGGANDDAPGSIRRDLVAFLRDHGRVSEADQLEALGRASGDR